MESASVPREPAIEESLERAWAARGGERAAPAKAALKLLESAGDQSERTRAFVAYARAMLATLQNDLEQAFALQNEALGLLSGPEDAVWQARLITELAVNASWRGSLDEAEKLYERGLAVVREQGLDEMEPAYVANLGILHTARGETARGLDMLLGARRLYARLGKKAGEGMALVNAGPAYRALGAYPEAIGALIEGIELLDREGLSAEAATGLTNLAVTYAAAGVPDAAIRSATEACDRAPPKTFDEVSAWTAVAYAQAEAGEYEAALEAGDHAVALARTLDEDYPLAEALLRLADTRRSAGRMAESEATYREALSYAERMDIFDMKFGCKIGLASLFEQRGEVEDAHALVAPLVDAAEKHGERRDLFKLHELLSRLLDAQGDPQTALKHLNRAQECRAEYFRGETDVRVRTIQIGQELRREREQSAEDLRKLSRRVMESQEEERRRVAGELHDGLGQRLALLAVEADMLAQSPPPTPEAVSSAIGSLAEQAQSIADQVHTISHNLHPALLTQLGLVGATRSVCDEVARFYDIRVDCDAEDVPRRIREDVALCLYRVVQEGLSNATRHGSASRARVHLEATAGEIRLRLTDEGSGFDPEHLDSPGIGLASMRERVHHLGGQFTLRSKPGQGTRIEVDLPLAPE